MLLEVALFVVSPLKLASFPFLNFSRPFLGSLDFSLLLGGDTKHPCAAVRTTDKSSATLSLVTECYSSVSFFRIRVDGPFKSKLISSFLG